MKESHEKIIVYAICEDQSIHRFAAFTENCVGDDIYGSYQVGSDIGNYKYDSQTDESSGGFTPPDVLGLQEYIKGHPNKEFDKIAVASGIAAKTVAFCMLVTSYPDHTDDVHVTKITKNSVSEISIPNSILQMLMLDMKHNKAIDDFESLVTD